MRTPTILLALTLALGLGLSGAAQAQQAKEPAPLKKIVLAEATRGEGWLPVYLAQTLGFFKEEGLDPQFVTYKDGPLALMGLLNGDAQFCIIGFEPVLMAYEKGQESKAILTTLSSQPYLLTSRPGITSLEGLRGGKIFAGMPGSAPYLFAKAALRNAGLNPDKDVTFVSLEYGAEIGALSRGDLDGAYVRATRAELVKKAGANILVDATVPAQHKAIYGSERYEATVVQVTDAYLKKDPATVQAFANAVRRAMAWQAANSDEEVARAVSPMFPGVSIDAAVIKGLRPCLSADGTFTKEGYGSVVDFCLKNGVIKKAIPMDGLVDPSFMAKAKP